MQSSATEDAHAVAGNQAPVWRTVPHGLISLFLLALAWAALDDVTTDNAATFAFEYFCLAGIAAWFVSLFARLVFHGRRILGIAMTALLGVAGLAVVELPPQGEPIPVWQPAVLYLAFAVCLIMSGWMILPGIRAIVPQRS